MRLGKAIPASVDMPSLIVQLDRAARGHGHPLHKIATGDREAAAAPAAAAPAAPSTDASGTPVAAGGETASSSSGTAAESANNAQATANQNAANAEQSGVAPTDTQTSTGGIDPTAPATDTGATTTTGLESIPLEFTFIGDFFDLADFFHDVKRFVRVADQNVLVRGRLMTVEGVQWSSDTELFPRLKASIKATVYLSPKSEGVTAGATPQGPSAIRRPRREPSGRRRLIPGPDRHRDPLRRAMNDFLLDLWHDLREKRLWPVAALLLVGLIAVPVTLVEEAEEPASVTVVAPEAKGPDVARGLAALTVAEDAAGEGSTLDVFDPSNPFKPPKDIIANSDESTDSGTGTGSTDTGTASSGTPASTDSAPAPGPAAPRPPRSRRRRSNTAS